MRSASRRSAFLLFGCFSDSRVPLRQTAEGGRPYRGCWIRPLCVLEVSLLDSCVALLRARWSH
jgi:hypothetical protein